MIDPIEKKLKEDVIADHHMLDEKTVDKIDKMCNKILFAENEVNFS
jgi:hypothetical protein